MRIKLGGTGATKIQASRYHNWIRAAKGEENVDPRIEELENLMNKVEDDFDYAIDGVDRLGREGMLDEAIKLLNTLSETLDSAIGIIGGDFEASKSIESFNEPMEELADINLSTKITASDDEDGEWDIEDECPYTFLLADGDMSRWDADCWAYYFASTLGYDEDEYYDLLHDINNLRADEWVRDGFLDEAGEEALAAFKKYIHYSLDDEDEE